MKEDKSYLTAMQKVLICMKNEDNKTKIMRRSGLTYSCVNNIMKNILVPEG